MTPLRERMVHELSCIGLISHPTGPRGTRPGNDGHRHHNRPPVPHPPKTVDPHANQEETEITIDLSRHALFNQTGHLPLSFADRPI